MSAHLHRIGRSPHTYFLLAVLTTGYIAYVLWLGLRWIVFLSGAVIVAGAIAFWIRQFPRPKPLSTIANLLQPEIFLSHLNTLKSPTSEATEPHWRSAHQQAEAIQHIAKQIAQREPTLIPDLLETLHTVLDLADQFGQALQVSQQVQTPHYQQLAQQRLQHSEVRLQQTHDQLQALHDQIALEHLERQSLTLTSGISERLRILIAENGKGILGD